MAPGPRVGLFGHSGFVGSAVAKHLVAHGCEVVPMTAPRGPGTAASVDPEELVVAAHEAAQGLDLRTLDAVVNAAGRADALASRDEELLWPNAALPVCLFRACVRAGVSRFVHVSSAAVQGRLRLDDSDRRQPHSPYARSKALGEQLLLAEPPGATRLVIYRPVGVHDASRLTTRTVVRLTSSRFAAVARTPQGPSPQLTRDEMGEAIAGVVAHPDPPVIVAHTGSGLTPYDLSSLLGDHRPLRVPNVLARVAVRAAALYRPGWGRRAEVLLFGQRVAPTWLEAQLPVRASHESWRRLGREVRASGSVPDHEPAAGGPR